jgi:hypothetical protein
MQILAGSIEAAETGFLHAGYISGYARSFEGHMLPQRLLVEKKGTDGGQSGLVMDLDRCVYIDTVAALKIEGEAPAVAPQVGVMRPGALDNGAGAFNLIVAVVFFSLVGLGYMARRWIKGGGPSGRTVLYAFAIVLLLVGAVAVYVPVSSTMARAGWGLVSAGTKPPWEGMTPQRYKDPALATRAIMQGIIADVLSSIPYPVTALTQIQKKVGLPVTEPTPGQAYALKTYGWDGWGRPFRLKATPGAEGNHYRNIVCTYELTSAGPDGAFDTPDDISTTCFAPDEHGWDNAKSVLFARKAEGDWNVLCRCWEGRLFTFYDLNGARKLTGSDRYDLVNFGAERRPRSAPIATLSAPAQLASKKEENLFSTKCEQQTAGKPYDPLVLIVLPKPDYI